MEEVFVLSDYAAKQVKKIALTVCSLNEASQKETRAIIEAIGDVFSYDDLEKSEKCRFTCFVIQSILKEIDNKMSIKER